MKAWPREVWVVVSARLGREDRSAMQALVITHCRDCQCLLATDSAAIAFTVAHASRQGRPIDFLCLDCLRGYDMVQVEVIDQTPGKQFTQRN